MYDMKNLTKMKKLGELAPDLAQRRRLREGRGGAGALDTDPGRLRSGPGPAGPATRLGGSAGDWLDRLGMGHRSLS